MSIYARQTLILRQKNYPVILLYGGTQFRGIVERPRNGVTEDNSISFYKTKSRHIHVCTNYTRLHGDAIDDERERVPEQNA